MTPRALLVLGALHGVVAVGLGAFGAHGLASRLSSLADGERRLEWWKTAAHYELVHAVAIVALALATEAGRTTGTASVVAGRSAWQGLGLCWVVGAAVFAGTLYAMTLGAPRVLGAITPVGGALLIAGWAWLGLTALGR